MLPSWWMWLNRPSYLLGPKNAGLSKSHMPKHRQLDWAQAHSSLDNINFSEIKEHWKWINYHYDYNETHNRSTHSQKNYVINLKIKLTSKQISLMTFNVIDNFSDKICSSSFNLKQHTNSLNIKKYIETAKNNKQRKWNK